MSDVEDPSSVIGVPVALVSGQSTGPVHRAFALLALVVAADGPVGVRELARRAGLSRSATGRLIGILAELGMVERTSRGSALPGAALATLTRRADTSPARLRDVLRPLAVETERTFGENAAVGIDGGAGFLYLVSARSSGAVQVPDPTGESYPFHLVAPGLVAMAAWSEDRLSSHLEAVLEISTTNSVVDPAAIRTRLRRVRRAGYAWTDQELDLEVNGLAAPVVDGHGDLVAVATLYGPSYRLSEIACPELGATFAAFVANRSAGLLGRSTPPHTT